MPVNKILKSLTKEDIIYREGRSAGLTELCIKTLDGDPILNKDAVELLNRLLQGQKDSGMIRLMCAKYLVQNMSELESKIIKLENIEHLAERKLRFLRDRPRVMMNQTEVEQLLSEILKGVVFTK